MDNLAQGQAMSWNEAPPPAVGLVAAGAVAVSAVAVDTALATVVGHPGIVLDWLPLVAAGAAFLVALRFAGEVRQAALTATIALLALVPFLNPSPEPWMYAVPLAGVVLALGVALTPTARAVASVPAIGGMLTMLELLPNAGSATLFGAMAVGAYLMALWLQLPSFTLPTWSPSPPVAATAPTAQPSSDES